ncbi:MAG: mechanosensitive ion channel family protein [Streptosporangiaceae bacterium]|jgi:small-conductance mechanosensitive channel
MQNGRQLDLSAQVEAVKRRTQPWKAIIALLFAIAAGVISGQARHDSPPIFSATSHLADRFIWAGMAVAFLVFGSIATYSLAGKIRELLRPRTGTAHAAVAGYIILIVGAFATLVITLELFAVPVGQLVLGGALTSVFVGIAAQQALGNVFAGLVLLFARPFQVGDAIRLRAGALGGTLDGIVTDIGITYVRFDTDGSVMSIPNSQVLNAIVGPIPPAQEEDSPVAPDGTVAPGGTVAPDGKSGTPGGPENSQPRPGGPT